MTEEVKLLPSPGGPTTIRYMTPKEEGQYSTYLGGILRRSVTGEGGDTIFLRRGGTTFKGRVETLTHEMGHMKYPVIQVEEILKSKESGQPYSTNEEMVFGLFSELGALYHTYSIHGDAHSYFRIKEVKERALELGMTHKQVRRVDKLARKRVGYEGRELWGEANLE